jgi:hypothetical protein
LAIIDPQAEAVAESFLSVDPAFLTLEGYFADQGIGLI